MFRNKIQYPLGNQTPIYIDFYVPKSNQCCLFQTRQTPANIPPPPTLPPLNIPTPSPANTGVPPPPPPPPPQPTPPSMPPAASASDLEALHNYKVLFPELSEDELLEMILQHRRATNTGFEAKPEVAKEPDSGKDASCTICISDVDADSRRVEPDYTLPCGHTFHEACLMPWLKLKMDCPNCRLPYFPDREYPPLN